MAASVPDETNRTFSIDGTAAATVSAISTSRSVGAPKLEPELKRLDDRRADAGMGVPQDHRPPRADVIDVLVAVDVVQVGPLGPGHERRLAADRPERPRRAVHSAGDHAVGPDEGVVAAGKLEIGSRAGGSREFMVPSSVRSNIRSQEHIDPSDDTLRPIVPRVTDTFSRLSSNPPSLIHREPGRSSAPAARCRRWHRSAASNSGLGLSESPGAKSLQEPSCFLGATFGKSLGAPSEPS